MIARPDSHPWLLAIDTSTDWTGVALIDGQCASECAWYAGREQTVTVLTAIDQTLKRQSIEPNALRAIAVAVGPGMFSSLRVGLSTAKGLSWGLNLPIVGVNTLRIAAAPYFGLQIPVVSVVAAGRQRIVFGAFASDGTELIAATNGYVEEMIAAIQSRLNGPLLITGELDDKYVESLRSITGWLVPSRVARQRRPSVMAEIAWERWQAGDIDDAGSLDAVYLHAAVEHNMVTA